MKIKAREIKPGMVIARRQNSKKYDDIVLIISKDGFGKEISYVHYDYQDAYIGLMCGYIDKDEKVKVLTGKKRKKVLEKILSDLFLLRRDAERNVDLLRLIMELEKN